MEMITEEYDELGRFKWRRGDYRPTTSELRAMVIAWYGGRCEWCGIDDVRVLAIDHCWPKGDERRRGGRSNLPQWIIKHVVYGDVPKDCFRVLCLNCNYLAYKYGQENPGDITWGPRIN